MIFKEDNIVFIPERYEDYKDIQDIRRVVAADFAAAVASRIDSSPEVQFINPLRVAKVTSVVPIQKDQGVMDVVNRVSNYYKHNGLFEFDEDTNAYEYIEHEFNGNTLGVAMKFKSIKEEIIIPYENDEEGNEIKPAERKLVNTKVAVEIYSGLIEDILPIAETLEDEIEEDEELEEEEEVTNTPDKDKDKENDLPGEGTSDGIGVDAFVEETTDEITSNDEVDFDLD